MQFGGCAENGLGNDLALVHRIHQSLVIELCLVSIGYGEILRVPG